MIAWGMACDQQGTSAVIRHDDKALWVRDVSEWTGMPYPLEMVELIAMGGTTAIQSVLADHQDWFSTRGVGVDTLTMALPIVAPDRVVGIGRD